MPFSIKTIVQLTFFFIANVLRAQEFGGLPPSVKWKQTNTGIVRVIFPRV
jgi:hypothetical protein